MFKHAISALAVSVWWVSSPAQAEDSVAFGLSRPPYVLQDRATGISIELFKRIYDKLDRPYRHKYVSNERLERELASGALDVAVEVKKTNPKAFYSQPFLSYRNFIVTRVADNAQIDSFADLSGRSVCTWQNADDHLGPTFRDAMRTFKYFEYAHQDAQVKVFLGGRCDAVIIDEKIFKYWANTLSQDRRFKKRIVSLDFQYHPVPGQSENEFYVGFRDRELRDRFDKELAAIRKNGEYERIVQWKDWTTSPSR